jgi:hypothetical protein
VTRILGFSAAIGQILLGFLAEIGRVALFCGDALRHMVIRPYFRVNFSFHWYKSGGFLYQLWG